MKTLAQCKVCNHARFHDEPCRYCLDLTKVRPDPVVGDLMEKPVRIPQPRRLEKRKPRPPKENMYELPHSPRAYSVMKTRHRDIIIGRVSHDYKLSVLQAGMVVQAWMADRGLVKENKTRTDQKAYERMGEAHAHLYDKYGKYEEPHP